jgi:hypothetical protein
MKGTFCIMTMLLAYVAFAQTGEWQAFDDFRLLHFS